MDAARNKHIEELIDDKIILEIILEKKILDDEQSIIVQDFIVQIDRILNILENEDIKIKRKLMIEIEKIVKHFNSFKISVGMY